MKNNRRDFLKLTGFAGAGILANAITPVLGNSISGSKENSERFNMCGYAAPKLETVRIGFIGLGNRGPAAVDRMTYIDGVDIRALCDLRPDKVNAVKNSLKDKPYKPEIYTGNENEWKKLCERNDIDLVYIATPWALHAPMAVYAMTHGKHVCVEVPAAKT